MENEGRYQRQLQKSKPYQAQRQRKRSKHQDTIFGHQGEADNVKKKQIRMKDQLY